MQRSAEDGHSSIQQGAGNLVTAEVKIGKNESVSTKQLIIMRCDA